MNFDVTITIAGMSNPLHNLKKTKKVPLPIYSSLGQRSGKNVPYRNAPYTSDESKLLEEITSNIAAERLGELPRLQDSRQGVNESISPHGSNADLSDHGLMSLMMTRLAQLEQKLQYQMKENSHKDKKIRILEDKVKILQKAREASSPGKVQELEKKCLLLQQQIHEMETFLADYGMIWVGEKSHDLWSDSESEDDSAEERILTCQDAKQLWKPASSVADDFQVDFDLIIHNIQDLNTLAGEGIGRIEHTTDGARLKMPDSVPLTLYANGLVMFSGPFRPYTDKITQICLKDLMDGYFPSELQVRYPDGVPFSVTDKRDVYFKDHLSQVFEGHGQLLGGDTKPSRLVPSNLNRSHKTHDSTMKETSQLPGRQLTVEQFLQRLPPSIIKEGKVIDVRTGVGNVLTGNEGPSGVTVVETSAVKDMKHSLEERRSASTRDLTTLRIKNEKGDHTYILKMKYTDTVGDVKAYLDKQRPPSADQYQIVSSFPMETYSDMNLTLEQCGLVPNATLHLQAKKTK